MLLITSYSPAHCTSIAVLIGLCAKVTSFGFLEARLITEPLSSELRITWLVSGVRLVILIRSEASDPNWAKLSEKMFSQWRDWSKSPLAANHVTSLSVLSRCLCVMMCPVTDESSNCNWDGLAERLGNYSARSRLRRRQSNAKYRRVRIERRIYAPYRTTCAADWCMLAVCE